MKKILNGNYETYLGIKYDSLEKYILKSFISCLDYRVFKYKIEKSFNVSEIKIAIATIFFIYIVILF